ncbi:MAG: hypothetical protein U9R02_06475 [Thermodesulfobacteriota bacterium]|nr:hypothetical protein [Thermodesulfobacteriota bacterium]
MEVTIGFQTDGNKFAIFDHIITTIGEHPENLDEDQIGIRLKPNGTIINEGFRSKTTLLNVYFPDAAFDTPPSDEIYSIFDVKRFISGLKACKIFEDSYDTIEITFNDQKIVFLSNTPEPFIIRSNGTGYLKKSEEFDLFAIVENVSKDEFKGALEIADLVDSEDYSRINPIKISLIDDGLIMESALEHKMAGGRKIVHGTIKQGDKEITHIPLEQLEFVKNFVKYKHCESLTLSYENDSSLKALMFYPNDVMVEIINAPRLQPNP